MKTKPGPKFKTQRLAAATEGFAKVSQAAEFLNVGRDFIYDLVSTSKLEHVRINDTIRIPWSALHDLVRKSTRRPSVA